MFYEEWIKIPDYDDYIYGGKIDNKPSLARASGSELCWEGYEMIGTKKKKGKIVPNCVPIKKFLQMIKLQKVGGDLIKGHLALYKNGTCWLVYNNRTQKIIEPCMDDEKKAIDLIDKLLEEEKLKENITEKINKKNIIKNKMKWIDYWKEQVKGKKFGSRAEVNAFMKEQAKIWREKYKK